MPGNSQVNIFVPYFINWCRIWKKVEKIAPKMFLNIFSEALECEYTGSMRMESNYRFELQCSQTLEQGIDMSLI